jgi:Gluconate 2-dehydrogenase subunit 3
MHRREAIKILATGTMLQLASPGMMALMREARTVAASPSAPRTLSSHQFETVKAMAEMIIPRTDTPGATDVGTADFIDLILTEWYEEPDRSRFLNGLKEVDTHCQSLFARDFVEASVAQQAEILIVFGEETEELMERKRDHAQPPDAPPDPNEPFYRMFRRLTLTAYYTSEDGATKELNFEIIPQRHDFCAEIRPAPAGQENQ